jgi:phosphohistidine phosphatase
MILYLLRHGDAVLGNYSDAERMLSSAGEEEINLVLKILVQLGASIDSIISSPLLRARQTAEIIKSGFSGLEIEVSDYLTPSSDHRQIIQRLNIYSKSSVLLVGHEPHLSTFISFLVGGSRNFQIEMKKASIACVDSPIPIKPGAGLLKWLLSQKEMGRFL